MEGLKKCFVVCPNKKKEKGPCDACRDRYSKSKKVEFAQVTMQEMIDYKKENSFDYLSLKDYFRK